MITPQGGRNSFTDCYARSKRSSTKDPCFFFVCEATCLSAHVAPSSWLWIWCFTQYLKKKKKKKKNLPQAHRLFKHCRKKKKWTVGDRRRAKMYKKGLYQTAWEGSSSLSSSLCCSSVNRLMGRTCALNTGEEVEQRGWLLLVLWLHDHSIMVRNSPSIIASSCGEESDWGRWRSLFVLFFSSFSTPEDNLTL